MKKEGRNYVVRELRAVENERGEKVIEGHAAVFGQTVKIGTSFYEVIDFGAFPESALQDVTLHVNHDRTKIPLARTQSGTLKLAVDSKGLAFRASLDVENNVDARALYSAVKRGDLRGMSFAFEVELDEWQDLNGDMPTRHIKKIGHVYEISAVTTPAYSETDINARAANTLAMARRTAADDAAAVKFFNRKLEEESKMYNDRYSAPYDDTVDERTKAVNSVIEGRSDAPRFIQGKGFIPAREYNPQDKTIEQREVAGKRLQANAAVSSPYNAIGELRSMTLDGNQTLVVSKHTSPTINPDFSTVSTLIDGVKHISLNGGESFSQPYVVGIGTGDYTDEGANAAEAETQFDFADINRAKVTAYAELSEEFAKLPAADYADVVFENIRTSMRQLLTKEILVGKGIDERGKHQLVGIFSDKATAINPDTDIEMSQITDTTLDDILFRYGGGEDVESQATLIISKFDLLAFSKVRTSTKQKFYDIQLNGNGNSGTINSIPFVLSSACKPLSLATNKGGAAVGDYCMCYGHLENYLLCEFTPMEIKLSDDFKFRQGLKAFRGVAFVGGNVTKRNGFIRVKRSA